MVWLLVGTFALALTFLLVVCVLLNSSPCAFTNSLIIGTPSSISPSEESELGGVDGSESLSKGRPLKCDGDCTPPLSADNKALNSDDGEDGAEGVDGKDEEDDGEEGNDGVDEVDGGTRCPGCKRDSPSLEIDGELMYVLLVFVFVSSWFKRDEYPSGISFDDLTFK